MKPEFPENRNAEHIQVVIDNLPAELDLDQRIAAKTSIRDRAGLFSTSGYDIGRTNLVQHVIDKGMHRPFKQPLRRHPLTHLEIIDEHVSEMLRNDVIEPTTTSPWTSNVVSVRNASGQLRICVDYRHFNLQTYKDSYSLPLIETCLVRWEDRRSSAAWTSGQGIGRLRYTRSRPKIQLLLLGEERSDSLRLETVMNRLQRAGLKLNQVKCKLFELKPKFLGHVVSGRGIAPDSEKVRDVVDWPTPRNLTEVRDFVALTSYYRRFFSFFADIARPIHLLTRKTNHSSGRMSNENHSSIKTLFGHLYGLVASS